MEMSMKIIVGAIYCPCVCNNIVYGFDIMKYLLNFCIARCILFFFLLQLDSRCLEALKTLDNDLGQATSLPLLGCLPYKQMVWIFNFGTARTTFSITTSSTCGHCLL